MVYNVNRLIHLNPVIAFKDTLSATTYPAQNPDMIGKIIKLRYNKEGGELYNRYICDNDKNDWKTNPSCRWCLILRYDTENPNRMIVMNEDNEVIVTTTNMIDQLYDPVGLEINGTYASPKFSHYEPIVRRIAGNTAMAASIARETVHSYPVQLDQILGRTVYTEYMYDITNTSRESAQYFAEYEGLSVGEIRERLIENGIDIDGLPDDVITNVPYYLDRFINDRGENPRRSFNMGLILRADAGGEGYAVVAEYRGDSIAFVCSDEAYFYTDLASNNVTKKSDLYDVIKGRDIFNDGGSI